MIEACGTVSWFKLSDGSVEFWMRNDGPMTLDDLFTHFQELCEREPSSANPS